MPRKSRKKSMRPVKEKPGLFEVIAGMADVPLAALTGGFRMELFSNRELLIENHKGILEYGDRLIRINCGTLVLKIEGEDLTLVAMNEDELSLKGHFLSISYVN